MFQLFPDEELEVRITLPPEQKARGPPAEMVGVEGVGFTVTTIGVETAELHPPETAMTVKEPEAMTVMDCVVCTGAVFQT